MTDIEKLKSKKIILCADDYALSKSVSLGIRELIQNNRLSATSVMTLSKFWEEDGKILREEFFNFDVGIHFTLTDQKPLEDFSDFTSDGFLPKKLELIKLSLFNKLPLKKIKKELILQLEKFLKIFKRLPSHLDSHHHVHVLPGIREIILEIYDEFFRNDSMSVGDDCKKKAYIRSCDDSFFNILSRKESIKKALKINFLSKKFHKMLNREKIPTNNGFSGIYDFNINDFERKYEDIFPKFLKNLTENSLIMCHPGYVDDALKKVDEVVFQREQELKYFLSDKFLEDLAIQNFRI